MRTQSRVLSPSHRGTRCSPSGSCRGAAPLSGAFRRCSPADSPVGALAHRCAQLRATHTATGRLPLRPVRLGATREQYAHALWGEEEGDRQLFRHYTINPSIPRPFLRENSYLSLFETL